MLAEDGPTPAPPAPPLVRQEPRREWIPPDFRELSTAPEITAYSGTWD
ncbi:MAG: pyrroloquinoline quinone precursor peptide PqqA [Egibacteraceae bacterium]